MEKEGASSPLLAPAYNNLANLYKLENKYEDMIPLLKRCMEICEKDPGSKDHLMDVVGSLGMAYDKLGKTAEAKVQFARYFAMSAQLLGMKADDPKAAIVLNQFAQEQRKQDNVEIAELCEKALEYRTK